VQTEAAERRRGCGQKEMNEGAFIEES